MNDPTPDAVTALTEALDLLEDIKGIPRMHLNAWEEWFMTYLDQHYPRAVDAPHTLSDTCIWEIKIIHHRHFNQRNPMPTAKKSLTKHAAIPYQPGIEFEGGYLAGHFRDDLKPYALIVSHKTKGEQAKIAWGVTDKLLKTATSYSNGPANTATMAKAGCALAKWALGLKIGGYSDWYLPSRLECLLIFCELAALKTFGPTQPNGFAHQWHWTSTQYSGDGAYAWCESFCYGYQSLDRKGHQLRARAVRRITL